MEYDEGQIPVTRQMLKERGVIVTDFEDGKLYGYVPLQLLVSKNKSMVASYRLSDALQENMYDVLSQQNSHLWWDPLNRENIPYIDGLHRLQSIMGFNQNVPQLRKKARKKNVAGRAILSSLRRDSYDQIVPIQRVYNLIELTMPKARYDYLTTVFTTRGDKIEQMRNFVRLRDYCSTNGVRIEDFVEALVTGKRPRDIPKSIFDYVKSLLIDVTPVILKDRINVYNALGEDNIHLLGHKQISYRLIERINNELLRYGIIEEPTAEYNFTRQQVLGKVLEMVLTQVDSDGFVKEEVADALLNVVHMGWEMDLKNPSDVGYIQKFLDISTDTQGYRSVTRTMKHRLEKLLGYDKGGTGNGSGHKGRKSSSSYKRVAAGVHKTVYAPLRAGDSIIIPDDKVYLLLSGKVIGEDYRGQSTIRLVDGGTLGDVPIGECDSTRYKATSDCRFLVIDKIDLWRNEDELDIYRGRSSEHLAGFIYQNNARITTQNLHNDSSFQNRIVMSIIFDYNLNGLDENDYISLSVPEISEWANVPEQVVAPVLDYLIKQGLIKIEDDRIRFIDPDNQKWNLEELTTSADEWRVRLGASTYLGEPSTHIQQGTVHVNTLSDLTHARTCQALDAQVDTLVLCPGCYEPLFGNRWAKIQGYPAYTPEMLFKETRTGDPQRIFLIPADKTKICNTRLKGSILILPVEYRESAYDPKKTTYEVYQVIAREDSAQPELRLFGRLTPHPSTQTQYFGHSLRILS
ncbi:MAG: hypothetical protein V1859_05965 [archaeon]